MLALLLLSSAAAGETYYIPIVDSPLVLQGSLGGEAVVDTKPGWYSTISYFNPSNMQLPFTIRAIYGGDAYLLPGCTAMYEVPAHQGGIVKYLGGCPMSPTNGPGFVAIETDPGVLLAASVQREFFRANCASLGSTPIAFGETSLPIYRGLFPKNGTAYTGLINLGAPFLPPSCGGAEEQSLRRVNVTLFNAGAEEALFTIHVLPASRKKEAIAEITARLAANEVRQLNKISIPYLNDRSVDVAGDGLRVWISVTADQPFLYYVSTPFETTTANAISVQVFEARLGAP